jgi:hypothetical protein
LKACSQPSEAKKLDAASGKSRAHDSSPGDLPGKYTIIYTVQMGYNACKYHSKYSNNQPINKFQFNSKI